jgi:23S rRNA (adenine2503-C2)-methyltransferase
MAMLGRKRGRNPASISVLMLMLLLVSRSEPLDGFTATPSLFPRSHRHRHHHDGASFVVDSQRPSRNSCRQAARLQSSPPSLSLLESDRTIHSSLPFDSPLSMSIDELADRVFQGRTHPARQLWKSYYRIGLDPLESSRSVEGTESECDDDEIGAWSLSQQQQQRPGAPQPPLGRTSLRQLQRCFGGGRDDVPAALRATVADLASVSSTDDDDDDDGTTKLLVALKGDGRQIETVIIPWWKTEKENERASVENDMFVESAAPAPAPHARSEYSTLCVSSQVGCRQACSFCRTGMQGLARSLTADEILAQVVLANAVIRGHHRVPPSKSDHRHRRRRLPDIGNVVFMGMGEPADNARAVVTATKRLVDPHQFALPPKRITISTVSPSPDAFRRLLGMEAGGGSSGDTGAQLAWSLHSSRNEVRKLLVPTSKHTVEELREGLIDTLRRRSRKRRSVLIEMTMLDSVNDSVDDAIHLAAFCSKIVERVDGVKVVVNLIPWNDIRATTGPAAHYRPSPHDRVLAYQDALVRRGIRCYVRTTRGYDDLAACGQLSTKASAAARIDALTK